VTLPIETLLPNPPNPPIPILESGLPFFVGQTNSAGVPLADLFCLECHAPYIFIPPNPPWPLPDLQAAPDISFEITNKYYDSSKTVSNFFYAHGHQGIGSPCFICHSGGGKAPTSSPIINGHFTHLKNASCTYCHDPHGTPGTYVGVATANVGGAVVGGVLVPNILDVQGIQRGHLLGEYLFPGGELVKDSWLLTTAVQPLPFGGGYFSQWGYPSFGNITNVQGASSCFVNNRLNPQLADGCHSIQHLHTGPSKPVKLNSVCNRVACHQPFIPLLARKGDKTEGGDKLAPAPPK